MNRRLVESLAEAIIALPVEDYSLFQNTLMAKMIKKTPGVCGGHACIRDTRIAAWTIISLINQGSTDGELIADFPGLTVFDLLTIKEYYQSHQQEIDNLIYCQGEENFND
ncbi:DUF433 domain-containing protein [Synechocystis salina LEGE 06155]|nr:DUF433 domain-containing protein [Synechocystis salina LEGE 06155]